MSWNVAGRRDGPRAQRLTQQADAIASEDPDVVALQEVTRESDRQWRGALADRGLAHVASTTHLLAPGRRYANLLASRWPLDVLSLFDPENDFPEKLLAAELHHPERGVEVHVFHAPTGVGAGWGKIRALEALHRLLEVASDLPRVVCGDFNAPQAEPLGRPLVTFAQDAATGELRRRPERWYRDVELDVPWDPERWDQAERQVIAPHGSDLIDVYRFLHPDGQDHSWVWRGRGHEVARRFDHVFASRTLQPNRSATATIGATAATANSSATTPHSSPNSPLHRDHDCRFRVMRNCRGAYAVGAVSAGDVVVSKGAS